MLVAGLVVLLAAVAAAAGMARPGEAPTRGFSLPPTALVAWGGAAALATGLALSLGGPFWSRREKSVGFVLALLLLLGFAILAERSYNAAVPTAQQQQRQATATQPPQAAPTPLPSQAVPQPQPRAPAARAPASGVPAGALAAIGAAALLLALAALRLGRRGGDGGMRDRAAAAALDSTVAASMDDLSSDADPRRAIVAAWLAMGDALARHGLRRDPAEAPLEYMRRALGSLRVHPESVRRLTALFERARYSDHAATARMRDDALAALQGVRDDLQGDDA